MSRARLVVTAVLVEGRSKSEVARSYGMSRRWVGELVQRFQAEGEAGLEPRSRRPHHSPTQTPPEVEDEIVRLCKQLADAGLDAGAETIVAHLQRAGIRPGPGGGHGVADPDPPRSGRPAAPEASQVVVRPVRGRPAQREAGPDGSLDPVHWRIRRDIVDRVGTVILRHNSKLHHIGIGRLHTGTRILLLVDDLHRRRVVLAIRVLRSA